MTPLDTIAGAGLKRWADLEFTQTGPDRDRFRKNRSTVAPQIARERNTSKTPWSEFGERRQGVGARASSDDCADKSRAWLIPDPAPSDRNYGHVPLPCPSIRSVGVRGVWPQTLPSPSDRD
jgi:hypothetical protein